MRRGGRLVAFVLRRGQAPVLVPLGASRPIDEAVRPGDRPWSRARPSRCRRLPWS